MGIAAVPHYLGNEFKDTPPGHRFGLYFPCWQESNWEMEKEQGKTNALKQCVLPLHQTANKQLAALRRRQDHLAQRMGDALAVFPARSTAPFMTGTGMEHPLENGFAFLNPYGLPYLPGAGVKGVVRRAAEELREGIGGDNKSWDPEAINALFGFEAEPGDQDAQRNRGALVFWDVYPKPAGDKLSIDIMTPHYGEYYEGKTTPHDSGQPNPIVFLTLPPKSEFVFYVQYRPNRAGDAYAERWRGLLQAAFAHAFDWLGFGAKTAVGYGQMQEDADQKRKRAEAEQQRQAAILKAQAEAERQAALAALTPLERSIQAFLDKRPNRNEAEFSSLLQALDKRQWQGEDAIAVARRIQSLLQKEGKWRPKSQVKNPDKDKEYQRTLKVLAYLEGKKP